MAPPPDDPRDDAPGSEPRDGFAHGDDAWEESAARQARDRWADADAAWQARWADAPPDDDPVAPYRKPEKGPSPARAWGAGMHEAGPYLGLGLQIAASMAFFVGLGYLADRTLGTSPWGLLVGAVLGFAGILALVVKLSAQAGGPKPASKKPGTGEPARPAGSERPRR